MEKSERSGRINLRLTPSVFDRLQLVSVELGLPPSTICSLAVGEYLAKKSTELEINQSVLSGAQSVFGDLHNQISLALQSDPSMAQSIIENLSKDDG